MVLLASTVQWPLVSHTSAACTAPDSVLKPPALVPPVTRTWPGGRTVALRCRRAKCIEAVLVQCGDATFVLMLMISAVSVGAATLGSGLLHCRYPPPPA